MDVLISTLIGLAMVGLVVWALNHDTKESTMDDTSPYREAADLVRSRPAPPGLLMSVSDMDERWAQDYVGQLLATQIRDIESTADAYYGCGLVLEASRMRLAAGMLRQLSEPTPPPVAADPYDRRSDAPVGREL